MNICATGISLRGPIKPQNTDAFCVKVAATSFGECSLLALSSGAPHAYNGELASAMFVQACSAWFEQEMPNIVQVCQGNVEFMKQLLHVELDAFMQKQNRLLFCYGAENKFSFWASCAVFCAWKEHFICVCAGSVAILSIKNTISNVLYLKRTNCDENNATYNVARGFVSVEPTEEGLAGDYLGANPIATLHFYDGKLEENTNYLLANSAFVQELAQDEFNSFLSPAVLDRYEENIAEQEVSPALEAAPAQSAAFMQEFATAPELAPAQNIALMQEAAPAQGAALMQEPASEQEAPPTQDLLNTPELTAIKEQLTNVANMLIARGEKNTLCAVMLRARGGDA